MPGSSPVSYDYTLFCELIARRDGWRCWLPFALTRQDLVIVGREIAADMRRYGGVRDCDGQLDGHHLIAKQRIVRAWRTQARALDSAGPRGRAVTLAEWLADPRLGRLVCRRHHDLLERRLLTLTRAALPDGLEELAAELGLMWSIERDYPVSA